MIRQGDVLLVPATIPETATKIRKDKRRGIVLAEGEATGHAHTIASRAATAYRGGNGDLFVVLAQTAKVQHQEHEAVELQPGTYRVVRQREWNAGEARRVID